MTPILRLVIPLFMCAIAAWAQPSNVVDLPLRLQDKVADRERREAVVREDLQGRARALEPLRRAVQAYPDDVRLAQKYFTQRMGIALAAMKHLLDMAEDSDRFAADIELNIRSIRELPTVEELKAQRTTYLALRDRAIANVRSLQDRVNAGTLRPEVLSRERQALQEIENALLAVDEAEQTRDRLGSRVAQRLAELQAEADGYRAEAELHRGQAAVAGAKATIDRISLEAVNQLRQLDRVLSALPKDRATDDVFRIIEGQYTPVPSEVALRDRRTPK